MAKPQAGFAWLKAQAPEVYRDWRKYTRKSIDAFDWGYLHANGISKPRANTKESLNYWLGNDRTARVQPRRPYSLSLARMQAATEQHESTVYVCSHPHSHLGFVLLDVDDKEGTYGDALETCQHVSDLLIRHGVTSHPLFMQPSTFGYGYHGYAFIQYPHLCPSDIRSMYNRLQDWLGVAVRDAGYHSTVEIKGHPPIVSGGIYSLCGQLAKFPRLGQDLSQYRRWLYETPALSIPALYSVITTSLRGERRGEKDRPTNGNEDVRTGGIGGVAPITTARRPKGGMVTTVAAADPAQRMGELARSCSRQLGRPTTAAELLAEYEHQNQHTGEDHDGNRQTLAMNNADWVASNWNQCLAQGGRWFDASGYQPLISQYVTPAIRRSGSSRVTYDNTDLAICLYTVEKSEASGDYGCPVTSFWRMAQTLGRDWGDWAKKQNTIKMKVARVKQVLLAAGLIRVVDNSYRFSGDGKGRGKKYGLGRNHPNYAGETANGVEQRA